MASDAYSMWGLHSVQNVAMQSPLSGFACLVGSSDGTDLWSACIERGTHWLSGDWLLFYRSVHGGSGICSELRTVNGSSWGLQLQDFIVLKRVPSPCAHLSLELAFVSRAFQTSPENLTAFVFCMSPVLNVWNLVIVTTPCLEDFVVYQMIPSAQTG